MEPYLKIDEDEWTYIKENFLNKTSATGSYFLKCLKKIGQKHSIVKEVRGKGMFIAMELNKPGGGIVNNCMKRGFLINCIQLNILRFIPPLIITRKEIDSLMPVLSDWLTKLNNQ